MILPLQNFATLVQNMAAGVQGTSQTLVDLTVGSVLRAVLEASASIGLWLQWLILQVLAMTRAATSNGADLDSWVGDFALVRLPGISASGTVTFSRYTTGLAAIVPSGTLVRTTDASQSFVVQADTANAAWVASANGYQIGANNASVDVPVSALVAGSAGNVQGGAITQLASAIAGVDTVSNAVATLGGLDAESDAALRLRFVNYINSRSRATLTAVESAIASVQQGLRWLIEENVSSAGSANIGHFIVTVDDGSGSPSAALLTSVQEAIEAVRPVGSTYAVRPPVIVGVTVSLSLEVTAGTSKPAVAAAAIQAIASYVNALPIGPTLAVSKLISLVHGADAAVVSVSDVLINGAATDLVCADNAVTQSLSVVVN